MAENQESLIIDRLNDPAETAPVKQSWPARLRTALWSVDPAAPKLTRARVARYHLLPLGLYLLITMVISYPLVLHLTDYVIGDNGDAWQNIWNYWWTGQALLHHHNPYQTPDLYAPYGVLLYLHSLNLFNALVSLPIQWLFGVVAAFNFVVLLSFTLVGYFTYLLVARLTGSYRAGFISGIIFAFSSYQTSQLFLGQANLFASEWLPAYAYALVGANSSRGRTRTLFGVLGVVSLIFTMLCDWQYIIFAFLFTVIYTLYALITRRSLLPVIISAIVGLIYLPFALPLVFKTFQEINDKLVPPTADSFVRAYSADLLSFFLPSPRQVWLGSWANSLAPEALEISHNRAIFIGVLPVVLALIGLWRARWNSLFWGSLAVIGFALALGPMLQINGVLHADIGLPFQWIEAIPGLNIARVPVRFVVLIVLALAVLGGYGVALLQDRWLDRLKPRASWAILGVLAALLLAEHLAIPFPATQAPVPAFYQQLAASSEVGAVLEIPYSKNRSISLYYQTIHHHPIVGGYLSRVVDYPVVDLPPITDMANRDGQDITIVNTTESDLGAKMLQYENVHWIVILLNDPQLDRASLPSFIERYAQPMPIYQDATMEVYRPKAPLEPDSPKFFIQTVGGWDDPEPSDLAPTHRMRWFERRGGMYAWNISNSSQDVSLKFDVWGFNEARHLTVRVDGNDVGQWVVKDLQHLDIPLTLSPGQHQIELRAPVEEPTSPALIGLGNDQRLLSFGVSNMQLVAKS